MYCVQLDHMMVKKLELSMIHVVWCEYTLVTPRMEKNFSGDFEITLIDCIPITSCWTCYKVHESDNFVEKI